MKRLYSEYQENLRLLTTSHTMPSHRIPWNRPKKKSGEAFRLPRFVRSRNRKTYFATVGMIRASFKPLSRAACLFEAAEPANGRMR